MAEEPGENPLVFAGMQFEWFLLNLSTVMHAFSSDQFHPGRIVPRPKERHINPQCLWAHVPRGETKVRNLRPIPLAPARPDEIVDDVKRICERNRVPLTVTEQKVDGEVTYDIEIGGDPQQVYVDVVRRLVERLQKRHPGALRLLTPVAS